jgi:TolB-like protein/class 3 adenylate cyclase
VVDVSEEGKGRVRRRLAAILVAGLSRLFPGDEKDSFTGLRAVLADVIDPLIPEFDGNIFKHTADLVLIEFDSVVEATRCAAALRDAMAQTNEALPNEQRIAMRIGINLGDIIAESGDIFGDGVNIAARLEALAEPGSIFVSEMAYHHVADKVDFDFEDLGPHNLKNIRRPVRIYRMGGKKTDQSADLDDIETVAASPSTFDDRRAIAVLPFANFSVDPEQEFFADGITEDIITMLAGWRAFPVIARNSTFTYKGKTVDIKKVGEELGLRYVLEGSVRKSGRRVRVTAQLIRADTNHHIMAERYDRDLTDLFELQDEIVTAIAGAIQPELLKFERERIAEHPPQSEDAYELYQRGMWHHYRQNKPDNTEAQAYFRRALAIELQYPQATAALSIALSSAAMVGWDDDADAHFENAFNLAQQAVALDPRYPNAHFAFGLACMWTRRSERGIAAFEEAIKFNPPRMCCSDRCTSTLGEGKRRSSRRKRAFASVPAIRACSSGCPRWRGRTTSWGITRRPSKPGDVRGRSTEIGRTSCVTSSPGWPSSTGWRRRVQLLPSSSGQTRTWKLLRTSYGGYTPIRLRSITLWRASARPALNNAFRFWIKLKTG